MENVQGKNSVSVEKVKYIETWIFFSKPVVFSHPFTFNMSMVEPLKDSYNIFQVDDGCR